MSAISGHGVAPSSGRPVRPREAVGERGPLDERALAQPAREEAAVLDRRPQGDDPEVDPVAAVAAQLLLERRRCRTASR